jgi:hypothetical protein
VLPSSALFTADSLPLAAAVAQWPNFHPIASQFQGSKDHGSSPAVVAPGIKGKINKNIFLKIQFISK